MDIFGIGSSEILVIVVVVLIVFGPHRLPELARHFGRLMRMFRKASEELRRNLDIDFDDLPHPRDFRVDLDNPIEREYQKRFGHAHETEESEAEEMEPEDTEGREELRTDDPLKESPPGDEAEAAPIHDEVPSHQEVPPYDEMPPDVEEPYYDDEVPSDDEEPSHDEEEVPPDDKAPHPRKPGEESTPQ